MNKISLKDESSKDHLIEQFIKDPLYKIDEEGRIYTRLTKNGQGISKDWREMGYKKSDGYVRVRYKDDFLFVQRIIFRKFNGPLKPGQTIDHLDRNNSNNHPKNLVQKTQGENNKNKSKKYNKKKGFKMSDTLVKKIADKVKQKLAKKPVESKKELTEEEWDKMTAHWEKMITQLDQKLKNLSQHDIYYDDVSYSDWAEGVYQEDEKVNPKVKKNFMGLEKSFEETKEMIEILNEEFEEFGRRHKVASRTASSISEVSFPVKFTYHPPKGKGSKFEMGSAKDEKEVMKLWDDLGEKIGDGDLEDEGDAVIKDSQNKQFKITDAWQGKVEIEKYR